MTQYVRVVVAGILGLTIAGAGEPVVDLLPDIVTNRERLKDHDVRTDIIQGRVLLTLTNGTANVGAGPIHIFGVDPGPKDSDEVRLQKIKQRIFRSDGSHYNRRAGFFVYHPQHNHIHVEGWAIYRLREVLPGNGVGDVVAEGKKTSFCLIDNYIYDSTLPNFSPVPFYTSCTTNTQGISVGFEDVYDKSLPDQWVDVTGVPEGTYWLESEADPDDHFLESDETNNIARIKVTIEVEDEPEPDPVPLGFFAALLEILQQILEYLRNLFQRA